MYLLVRRNKACATAGSGAKAILFFSAFIFPLILWRADMSDLILSLIFFHSPRVNTRRGTWNVAPQLSDSFVGEKKNKKRRECVSSSPQPSLRLLRPCAVSRARAAAVWWGCIGAVRRAVFRCGVAWGQELCASWLRELRVCFEFVYLKLG